jgi:uncharacterized protein
MSGPEPQSIQKQAAVSKIEAWVREALEAEGPRAHGWLHTDRVRRNILALAPAEGVDPFLAELAALIHDVGRTRPGPEEQHGARSAAMAAPILKDLLLSNDEQEDVLHAVRWHNSGRRDTPLLCVLRDADMLDALGAIGIMRAFMSKGHLPAYDPNNPFAKGNTNWPTVSASDQVLGQIEFYHWLNTNTARNMAEERFTFMKVFVAQIRHELKE